MLYRAVLRTQKATAYKVMPKSQLPDHMEPEDFIKVEHNIYMSRVHVYTCSWILKIDVFPSSPIILAEPRLSDSVVLIQ